MTFMRDSSRAAEVAMENNLPVGLHLNFVESFSGDKVTEWLKTQHRLVSRYLTARKLNQAVFNPLLRNAFEYVFQSQWDEFSRLFGREPTRIDGHHHMHLCMNMLVSGRYPKGIKIRRNFTFRPGEKDVFNRLYRSLIDQWLISRFKSTDYFFSINPICRKRLRRMVKLARSADVELMVHPELDDEYRYLMSEEWAHRMSGKRSRGNGYLN
jgi:predicted glycoside hydrolase/deacetylase ChbG (UPF0249 family)